MDRVHLNSHVPNNPGSGVEGNTILISRFVLVAIIFDHLREHVKGSADQRGTFVSAGDSLLCNVTIYDASR